MLITILMWSAVYFAGLMLAFAVLMTLWVRVKGTALEIPFKIILGVPFLIADWLCNWTVMPLWFFPDFPVRPFELVTDRMQRYKANETGRRLRFAIWLCNYLNRYDPGHC